jgi:hypothetical protein
MGLDREEVERRMVERSRKDLAFIQNLKNSPIEISAAHKENCPDKNFYSSGQSGDKNITSSLRSF